MRQVELFIDDKIYSGWTGVEITRNLESLSGTFSLNLTTTHLSDAARNLKTGVSCYLNIGGNRVITGYVDSIEKTINSEDRAVVVTGRDKTGDLIDCAAIYQTGRWNNVNLEKIASDLCAPFGIEVVWLAKTGADNFKFWQIEPSETVFENLARAARHRGIIVTSDQLGRLVFNTVSELNIGTLSLGENIKSLNISDSFVERFSEYRVIGDSSAGGLWGETQTSAQSTRVRSKSTDSAIDRYRPTVIVADDNLTKQSAEARAEWEKNRAAAHGQAVSVTVRDWFLNSEILQPNRLIKIVAKSENYEAELLITSVTLKLSNDGGIVSDLVLMSADGFKEPAQRETTNQSGGARGIWK